MQKVLANSVSRRAVVRPRQHCRPSRGVRPLAYLNPSIEPELKNKVHAWFDNILRDDQPIDHLLASDAILTDHLNEACYKGAAAIKHRLSEFHAQHMHCSIIELGGVTDVGHNKVCAHWACTPKPGFDETSLYGSNIFVFNDDGQISQVVIAENPTFATIPNPKWQQTSSNQS